jgi:Uma2 family endonuclease
MSDLAPSSMTSDEFIAWAMEQPEGKRYELFAGKVVAMAPEQSAHALAKANIWRRLVEAIERDGLPCTAYPDGMAVEIDPTTIYEPDALVRCGPVVPPNTVKLIDPIIVVEVLSPSTRARDHGDKSMDYFGLTSVRHYLMSADRGSGCHPPRSQCRWDDTDANRSRRDAGSGAAWVGSDGVVLGFSLKIGG